MSSLAMRSHQKALAAIQAGKFEDETVPHSYRSASLLREWIEAEETGNSFPQGGRRPARRYLA